MSVTESERVCVECGRLLPITRFRFYRPSRGLRRHQCNDCRQAARRAGRILRRTDALTRYLTELKNADSSEQIESVLRVMLERFGGVVGLVSTWVEYHDRAMVKGGFAAHRCFEGVLRMLSYVENRRLGELPDLGAMDRKELGRLLVEKGLEMMSDE